MSRTRLVLTLVLVAMLAMLAGLAASTYLMRSGPDSRPEATEPQRRAPAQVSIAANA
jgi:hypothetical protein